MNAMAETAHVLETLGVGKTYEFDGERVEAVRGVDLAVAAGEFVALMGPSGSGKSTLLHLLGGLLRPTAGEVRLRGRSLSTLSDDELADVRRHDVALVFQAFNLVPVLNVEENIGLPAAIAGATQESIASRVDDLVTRVGLQSKRSRRPSQLSGGEQQRVAIARALMMEPAVLLADEPTGNLDSASSRDIVGLLRSLNEAGQTLVLVTHEAKIASQAQRIVFMRDGEIVSEARPNEEAGISRIGRFFDFGDD